MHSIPIQWPYSVGSRKALTALLVACGMKPGYARRTAYKMNLRQILRASKV